MDLDTGEDLETLAWLGACDLRERELAVRGTRIWVPRLVSLRERFPRVPAAEAGGEGAPYRLALDNPGQIGGLQMKTCQPSSLGPHDVEIEAAAALNLHDVMVTLGLLPSSSFERSALGRTVGMEASGVVRRSGSAVRTCRAGDAVVFTQGGCIANRAVVKDYLVFVKPAALSMEQAEIYATAGSESKREQLRALGVRAAFDSHSLGLCSLTQSSEREHRFSNVRDDEVMSMYARADLALYNSHGRLTAIVEVKSKMRTSSEWAALTRRNILAHGDFSGADFFLLITPDRMYMWKDAGTDPVPVPPAYEADMTTEFAPYFESVGVSPEEVSGHAFELVVGAWLGDVMRSARRTGEDTDTLRRLVDSGLRTAVMDGRLEYEAVV